jgi:hypothetical protein
LSEDTNPPQEKCKTNSFLFKIAYFCYNLEETMSVANQSNGSPTETWTYEEEYHPPFLPALLIVPPFLPLFWNYHVRVSDSKLEVGYSFPFHFEIERQFIRSAEVMDHINGLTQWGGWGYRKNLAWETGLIAKNGPGIRLTFQKKEGGRDQVIVFNSNDAEKVCHLLNTPVLNAVVH